MQLQPAGAPDPYRLTNLNFAAPPIPAVIGYDERHSAEPFARSELVGRIFTVISDGQSQWSNGVADGLYTVLRAGRIKTFNMFDGGIYSPGLTIYPATNPAIFGTCFGMTGYLGPSCWMQIADLVLADNWVSYFQIAGMAVGGTDIARHIGSGDCAHRKFVMAKRLMAAGIRPDLIVFGIGETDALLGTSEATFAAALATYYGEWGSALGPLCPPMMVPLETFILGELPAGSDDVRAGQAAAMNGSTIFQGPDLDNIGVLGRDGLGDPDEGDLTHFLSTGVAVFAPITQTLIYNNIPQPPITN